MPGEVTELSARNVGSRFANFVLRSKEASSSFAEDVNDENRPQPVIAITTPFLCDGN
jgi:hypothetical protein